MDHRIAYVQYGLHSTLWALGNDVFILAPPSSTRSTFSALPRPTEVYTASHRRHTNGGQETQCHTTATAARMLTICTPPQVRQTRVAPPGDCYTTPLISRRAETSASEAA